MIGASVVFCHPCLDAFDRLMRRVIDHATMVFVVDNMPAPERLGIAPLLDCGCGLRLPKSPKRGAIRAIRR
jgi:hypothetical protein